MTEPSKCPICGNQMQIGGGTRRLMWCVDCGLSAPHAETNTEALERGNTLCERIRVGKEVLALKPKDWIQGPINQYEGSLKGQVYVGVYFNEQPAPELTDEPLTPEEIRMLRYVCNRNRARWLRIEEVDKRKE